MFQDRLTAQLVLTIGSDSFTLPSGSVERFEVDVQPWGFELDVAFVVDSSQDPDAVFTPFCSATLIGVTFSFARAVEGDAPAPTAAKVVGYCVDRSVSEIIGVGVKGSPVVKRHYKIRAVDAARAFWTQHRPIDLYAAATMESVFDLHKPVGVVISYDWSILQEKKDILCLSLHGEGAASYYDFVVWYVDRNQGVLEFDARLATYRIAGKKARAGDAVALDAEDVDAIGLVFPEPPRFAGRVLNPFSVTPVTKVLTSATAATGVRRDVIEHTLIAADVDRRAQVEGGRFRARSHGVVITFKRCPSVLSQSLDFVTLGEGFSDAMFPSGKKYRGVRLRATGVLNADARPEVDDAVAVFDLDLTLDVEDAGSTVAWLPPFEDPRRIVRLEGTVVSVGGEDADRSWAAVENDNDSLWTYKINVPLYNKVIPVPFAPSGLSGHFFFPAYKAQRVLVDIDWDRARLSGFIDWADEARVPSASQGDQIVLGYQSTNGTIIKHDYQDAKPVLQIVRKNTGQTGTFSMGDGSLLISLSEVVTVPTSLPVFDVSPQVAAAKDEVTGEVGGAVGAVTSQFQGAVGQVSGQVDETAAAVDAEIGAAEKQIKSDLLAVDAELQGMAGDATAALMQVNNATRTAKAKVTNAVSGLDTVRAPLVDLDGRIVGFTTTVSLQNAGLQKEISEIDAGLKPRCDKPAAAVAALQSEVGNRIATLKTSIAGMGPGGTTGPFADLAALRSDLLDQQAAVGRLRSDIAADVSTCKTQLAGAWSPIESDVSSRKTATSAKYDALIASAGTSHGELTAKLQAAISAGGATASAEAAILRPGIDAIKSSAVTTLKPLRDQAFASLDALTAQVAAKKAQMEASAQSAGDYSAQTAHSIGLTVPPLVASADEVGTSLKATSRSLSAAATTSAQTLQDTTNASLTRQAAGVTAARTALETSAASAKQTLSATLGTVTSVSGTLSTVAGVPVKTALTLVNTTQTAAAVMVTTATTALDAALGAVNGSLGTLIENFTALVSGASTSLDALTALISGLRGQIMVPIEALQDILTELETIFQTAASVLTAFIDTAGAVLDAIPAVGLPEALVSPAVQGIQAAMSAVMPLITEAASAAGTQLQTMATTLLGQVDTAQTGAMTGITTFAGTMNTQIQAILPPVKAQLAAVQGQIDSAVTAFMNQLGALADAAVTQINTAIQTTATQSTTASSAAETALSTARTQLGTAVAGVRSGIGTSKGTLDGQIDTSVSQLEGQVDASRATFMASLDTQNATVSGATATLQTQLTAARPSIDAQLAQIKSQLAAIRPALGPKLASVQTSNQAAAADLAGSVPAQATLDAQLDAAWAGFGPRIASLSAAIAQI